MSRERSEEKSPGIQGTLSFAHSLNSELNTFPSPRRAAGDTVVSEANMVPILMDQEPASCTERTAGSSVGLSWMVGSLDSPGKIW